MALWKDQFGRDQSGPEPAAKAPEKVSVLAPVGEPAARPAATPHRADASTKESVIAAGLTIEGVFCPSAAALWFLYIWLCFATIIPLFVAFRMQATGAIVFAMFMPSFAILVIQLGWWLGKRDIEMISTALRTALK